MQSRLRNPNKNVTWQRSQKKNKIDFDEELEKKHYLDIPAEEDIVLRVTPKQGRAVIFDGKYYHTARQPKDKLRCIINFNIE